MNLSVKFLFFFLGLILISLSTVTALDTFARDPLVNFFVRGNSRSSKSLEDAQLGECLDTENPSKSKSRATGDPDPNTNLIIVNTPNGPLRGTKEKSRTGKWFYAFEGIKYAESKRFQHAEPVVGPWSGIYDARQPGPSCPQLSDGGSVNEDCLYLNVYFPYYSYCQDEKLPVGFHIHGGSFLIGAGVEKNRGENAFMDTCICLVSINYRLGALGYLTTGDDVIPGNLGQHDQVLALKWVKQNIEYFRGDPNRVTILGVSSGGAAVSHLMASPLAKGLFAGAISMSGTALSPFAIQRDPLNFAMLLGSAVKCSAGSTQELRSCLESKTVEEILNKQETLSILPFVFMPIIEPATAAKPFQTENPANRFRTGNFNQVPYMCGFVEDEAPFNDPMIIAAFDMAFLQLAPLVFGYDQLGIGQEEMDKISTNIRQFYFGNKTIGSPESRQGITDLASDRMFVQPTFETVNLTSKYIPVYPYVNTYKGGSSQAWSTAFETPMIAHADDVQYFANPVVDFAYGTEQYEFSQNIVALWTSFMKKGKPWDPEWRPAGNPVNIFWRQLDRRSKTLSMYLDERFTFWQTLGLSKYEYY